MKGDFTRFTHDPAKRFNRVYKQQGRAELDSDFNEYVDLSAALQRAEAVDVIGRVGVPKDDSYKIEVIDGNSDLLIHKGHIYVDGILCQLDANAKYRSQPDDAPQPALAPVVGRKDLVYLHVVERHVTWVEDAALLEPALQGTDTCTRVQTVARVRVKQDVGPLAACGNVANWPPTPSDATLTVDTKPAGVEPNPCAIPQSGGYRGLENRLYRVEVHAAGPAATATFKWSRDNGAVVVPVTFTGGPKQVQAAGLGRDRVLGLKVGDWVELSGDQTEWKGEAGTLARIDDISTDLVITLSASVSAHAAETHPKLRRWDQASDAVPVQPGTAVDLEDGLTVEFAGTDFRAGDYWTFTARVGVPFQPLADLPPAGVVHHHAPLAVVAWQADPATPGANLPEVGLCPPTFPPLTDIHAADVTFDGAVCKFGPGVTTVQQALDKLCEKQEECCTVVVRPGPNWQAVFDGLPPEGAHFCFRPGVYELASRVEVANKTAIVISGVGDAAHIVALKDECALRFVGCKSVTVRDLSAEGKVAKLGSGKQAAGIVGVIAVVDADRVTVENCALRSADGPHRTTACLSVQHAQRVVVRGNRFDAGVQQGGVLLVDVPTVEVDGNLITGRASSVGAVSGFLSDPQFRAAVRTRLVTHLSVGGEPPPGVDANVALTVGGQPVRFLAPATHVLSWVNLLVQNPLPLGVSATNVEDHILGLADRILLDNFVPSFAGIRNTILGNSTGAAQGITVGGTVSESVVIRSNRVSGFIQGVHVGLSAPSPNVSQAERVVIHDNHVGVALGMGATRGRHGIFVGNVRSLSVRGNRLTLSRPPGAEKMQIDGIRVFGRIGRMAAIRENHLSDFNIGIHFELRGPVAPNPMWMINDNLTEGASQPVVAPNVANKSNNFG